MGGAVTADFTFTVPDGQITDKNLMRLLESDSDTDFSGATAVGTPVTSGALTEMQFTDVSIADGKSYTIASTTSDNSLPIQLSVFTAANTTDGVLISWRTETEVNNIGFGIYRCESKDGNYTKIAFVSSMGNSAMPINYQLTDKRVEPGQTYFYHLEDVDITGERNKSDIIKVVVPFAQPIPEAFHLLQNYPNPFNPETWIPYQLSAESDVIVEVYDIHGRLVRVFDLEMQPAGSYLTKDRAVYWNGKNEAGERVASGVYFYRLKAVSPSPGLSLEGRGDYAEHPEAGTFSAMRRLVLVK